MKKLTFLFSTVMLVRFCAVTQAAVITVAFDIGNLNLNGTTTVTALVTYSKDTGLTTQAGRAVSGIFSNPVTVNPVAAPMRIGSFSYIGGNVTLAVSGGTPPYQLQVRADLTAG